MSTSVLVAIAGLMVTAVGTGLLGGRCIRSPRPSYIAWAIGMFALTVALLAQSIGFATGFGAVTFRVIQISAQLVAPVALAWGLVELVARGAAARFGARLAAAGLVVVVGVILATDPLDGQAVRQGVAVSRRSLPDHSALCADRAASGARGRGGHGRRPVRGQGPRPACARPASARGSGGGRCGPRHGGTALRAACRRRLSGPERGFRRARLVRHDQGRWPGLRRHSPPGCAVARHRHRALRPGCARRGREPRSGDGPGESGPGRAGRESGQWLAGPWAGPDAPDRAGGRVPVNGPAGARGRSGPR